ncbi:MAG: MBL fold metallo-hydrolase [Chloroflexi bacterium]|nr:MBL fold metallo-hydrolase [Chloroflexota bacterium]
MASSITINGVEFTRYVQASFKIKSPRVVVWADPHRIAAKEVGADRGDLVLVTHPHFDHMDPDAIRVCAKDDAVIVTNPVVAAELSAKLKGPWKVVAIKAGESAQQKGVAITAVAGYNQHHSKEQGFNTGFLFSMGGQHIFHAGDTGKVPEMGKLGPVDIALLPIGGTYTMDEAEAAQAVRDLIKPRVVIPMHYQYATAGDPEKFRSLVGAAARVEVLEPVLKVKAGG